MFSSKANELSHDPESSLSLSVPSISFRTCADRARKGRRESIGFHPWNARLPALRGGRPPRERPSSPAARPPLSRSGDDRRHARLEPATLSPDTRPRRRPLAQPHEASGRPIHAPPSDRRPGRGRSVRPPRPPPRGPSPLPPVDDQHLDGDLSLLLPPPGGTSRDSTTTGAGARSAGHQADGVVQGISGGGIRPGTSAASCPWPGARRRFEGERRVRAGRHGRIP